MSKNAPKKITCPDCGGYGIHVCGSCEGSDGWVDERTGEYEMCRDCDGWGTWDCTTCHCTGEITADHEHTLPADPAGSKT